MGDGGGGLDGAGLGAGVDGVNFLRSETTSEGLGLREARFAEA